MIQSSGKVRVAAIAVLLLSAVKAQANCESILALAKNVSVAIVDAQKFNSQARDFCTEQKRTSGKSSSGSLGVSYGNVGLDAGGSSTKTSEIAEKTCDFNSGTNVSSDAYQNYIQTVAPDALPAYQACVKARDQGVITIAVTTVAANRMAVAVTNASLDNTPITRIFAFQGETNASCFWGNGGLFARKSLTLEGNRTAVLTCDRSDASKPSNVTVFAESRGDVPVGLTWGAYKGEEPVNELKTLAARLASAETALSMLMPGAVVAFNAKDCPAGWSEYTAAQGRFVRGIDKAATAASAVDPDGLRAPGSVQGDMLASHKHGLPRSARIFVPEKRQSDNNFIGAAPPGVWSNAIGETVETGGAETRPKNVALLYCLRN